MTRRRPAPRRPARAWTFWPLLLLLGLAGLLFFLSADEESQTEVFVPSVAPTLILSATPTASASPSPVPSLTASPSPTAPPTASPPPPATEVASAPSFPSGFFFVLDSPLMAEGLAPTLGRYGGLYNNAPLVAAGHTLIFVPTDNPAAAFYLDAFEVANQQVLNYLNAAGLRPSDPNGPWVDLAASALRYEGGVWLLKDPASAALPAYAVSAWLARAYCENLGLRLPTPAEWQRATFWGGESAPARPYPWGDSPPSHALAHFNEAAPALGTTYEAGRSWVGAAHLAGNVSEWVQIDEETYGVVGGSFVDDLAGLEAALRGIQLRLPTETPTGAGFRCALLAAN